MDHMLVDQMFLIRNDLLVIDFVCLFSKLQGTCTSQNVYLISVIEILDSNQLQMCLNQCLRIWSGKALIKLYLDHIIGKAYPALNVFELGENVEAKAVCLASVSAPTIHVVPTGKYEPQHLSHTVSLQ